MSFAVDHLVIAAPSLEEGARWCEATLGVVPGSGGKHPLMGTHNRLLAIASPAFARAYLEIIAIDPDAPPPGRPRWFDLDDASLTANGPALIHWAVRCPDIDAALAASRGHGIDRGVALATTRGDLRWRIGVRPDGARLYSGALPTLIEWGDVHPADAMPDRGVALEALSVGALPDTVVLPPGVNRRAEPGLQAVFGTPRGRIVIESRP